VNKDSNEKKHFVARKKKKISVKQLGELRRER
jgi:hypothetical protein